MTFTDEINSTIAGLNIVLQPSNKTNTTPLTTWLSDLEFSPTWIPLAKHNGVHKVLAALPDCRKYPELLQQIFQQISLGTVLEWQGKSFELTGVEIDNHDLHVLEIAVFASEILPYTLGRAIHAQCFQWLTNTSPDLAEKLHFQDPLPLTLATKPSPSRNQIYIRIGILQRQLFAHLLLGMSRDIGNDITLTKIPCRLGKWIDIKHSVSYESLIQVPAKNIIELEFLSPTSFKQGERVQPFPLPELVFSNLLRRWNSLAPEAYRLPTVEWQGFICAYDLKTVALKMKSDPEIGAKGWIRYQFLDPQQAQIATTLSHFAGFAGVGRKTSMGMGQTKINQ
jgi:CRISPR-associated endoribonuclease Cas6